MARHRIGFPKAAGVGMEIVFPWELLSSSILSNWSKIQELLMYWLQLP